MCSIAWYFIFECLIEVETNFKKTMMYTIVVLGLMTDYHLYIKSGKRSVRVFDRNKTKLGKFFTFFILSC